MKNENNKRSEYHTKIHALKCRLRELHATHTSYSDGYHAALIEEVSEQIVDLEKNVPSFT
jgi:hypothetical protein